MESYDFSAVRDRRHSGCVKWDDEYYDDLIPMWVADMDFPTAPCVVRALSERVAHGVYGYEHVPESYYAAVARWFGRRHGWEIHPDEILPATGLLPALVAILHKGRSLLHGQGEPTAKGLKVIMQMPAYNGFLHCLTDNGVEITGNAMLCTDGHYTIDREDLERKAQAQRGGILLFCNPHNPTGRVWTREEMEYVADICRKYDLLLISDEIHGEVMPLGGQYIPMATRSNVSDRCGRVRRNGIGSSLQRGRRMVGRRKQLYRRELPIPVRICPPRNATPAGYAIGRYIPDMDMARSISLYIG